jgi:hypothetical protein
MVDLAVEEGVDLWDLIISGSASMDIKHGEDVLKVNANIDTFALDIWNLYKVKTIARSLSVLFKGIEYTDISFQSTEGGKGYRDMLNKLEGIAKILHRRGKTAVIKYHGKEIVKIGKGAQSLTLGLLGIRYVQITRKLLALKLMVIFREIPLKI